MQQTKAGLQPIEVRRDGEAPGGAELWRTSMQLAPAEFGAELDPAAAMAAVGLEPADAHPELPPQIVSTGLAHAMVPLADAAGLARTAPDYPAIDALLAPHGAVVLYLAWTEGDSGRARGYSRIVELGEDPATGSAVGPLCAYLAQRTGQRAITVTQGEEMGRPSVLRAEMEGERVRISGATVALIDGTVDLP